GHVAELLGRNYTLWPGYCPTHQLITAKGIAAARALHPNAPVLVHPECPKDVRAAADHALSTGGMCTFARESPAREIIVGTETGILHRLRRENPGKVFYPVSERMICPNMKKTTLENLSECLREMKHVVTVPEDVAVRARRAVEAMLKIS
ncbi:MAG: quinolinate synthase NadA, partial [Kiritimatiellia bacterium]